MRLPDGRAVWVDAGNRDVRPLDTVTAEVGGETVEGAVFVAPTQLLQPPPAVDGAIVDVRPRPIPDPACDDLPGADLPPLGTMWSNSAVTGVVVALDPVKRTVIVRRSTGDEVTVEV